MTKYRGVQKYRPVANTASASSAPTDRRFRLEDSKLVTTGWAWRAILMMALVALGLCINFAVQHYRLFYTGCWGVIALGWFAFSMWLWRQHTVWTNGGTVSTRSFR